MEVFSDEKLKIVVYNFYDSLYGDGNWNIVNPDDDTQILLVNDNQIQVVKLIHIRTIE